MRRSLLAVALLLAPCSLLPAQSDSPQSPRLPPPQGFRVYIVSDMEGLGSVSGVREVIAGTEGENYKNSTSTDYWDFYRDLMTREVNAAINGARQGGARDFVVNEGHGGNLFRNILPWELDTAAILIRGYPRPLIMTTAIDSSVGTLIFTAAHAGAGSNGVLSHTYAFDDFTVNGHRLNEVGINALVASEYGVAVSMVTGDQVVVAQAKEILGPGIVGVVVKQAFGRTAAMTLSPARVRQMIADSAAVAVRRAMRGEFKPYKLAKPYQVVFTLRKSYPDSVAAGVDSLHWPGLEKTGPRAYRYSIGDARQIGYLLDAIEGVVLKP